MRTKLCPGIRTHCVRSPTANPLISQGLGFFLSMILETGCRGWETAEPAGPSIGGNGTLSSASPPCGRGSFPRPIHGSAATPSPQSKAIKIRRPRVKPSIDEARSCTPPINVFPFCSRSQRWHCTRTPGSVQQARQKQVITGNDYNCRRCCRRKPN